MKLIVLSDIHANLSALKRIFEDVNCRITEEYSLVILGDTINYGLRPNETLELIKEQKNIKVLLAGNHEMALLGFGADKFSAPRGKQILDLTKELISHENISYIDNNFIKDYIEIEIDGKLYLFIHGSIQDKFWGTIGPSTIDNEAYKKYDVVFSGHSHKPHFMEFFFENLNESMRNKKKTIFINPGSVGQPRNHNSYGQYVMMDTQSEEVNFCKVLYSIKEEMNIYDGYDVDLIYKRRLNKGI